MKIKTFSTTDFQICVVLSALGFKLASIDKSLPRFVFNFENDPKISVYINKFYKGQLSLDPRRILVHTKFIKDRMYGGY